VKTLAAFLLAIAAHGAIAQDYPSKPVRLINPFPAGGPLDITARALGEKLSQRLKQPFIVENRAGASGNIGADAVAKAPADGYTLLVSLDTVLTVNPWVYRQMPFDAANAFAPISTLATFDQMLVAHPSVRAATLAEFVALAKREQLTYASAGRGSPGHLTMELFAQTAGIKLLHVPYKGNAPAVTDLLGGQVQTAFIATPGVAPQVKTGKLKAYAVSGKARSPLAPEVPTLAEAGYADATTEFAFLLLAPAGVAKDVLQVLEPATSAAMTDPKVAERLAAIGIQALGSPPGEAVERLRAGSQKWGRIAKALKLQLD
jgi:tripartite-type tricarboxylate transporter receptor subunit TctC